MTTEAVTSVYTLLGSSITDWIQAIVGIALFYTIYLQYKANRTQSQQLQISLVPRLKVVIEQIDPFFNPHNTGAGSITVTVERNNIYNMKFYILDDPSIVLEQLQMNGSNLADGDNIVRNFTFPKDGEPLLEAVLPIFRLLITFKDILGNDYSQEFKYFEGRILPSVPKSGTVKGIN